jgi:hypothetical protein
MECYLLLYIVHYTYYVQRTHITNDIKFIDITVLFHLKIDCTEIVTALIDCHTRFWHVLVGSLLLHNWLYRVVMFYGKSWWAT